jgi:exopolysaccharide biosynthesis polyprenyl glycosylphosphotransferase
VNTLLCQNAEKVSTKGPRVVGVGETKPSVTNNGLNAPAHPPAAVLEYPRDQKRPLTESGEVAPERRDRPRPDRPFAERASRSAPPHGSLGSLLPRPYLLSSRTAWTALDFAAALCCGTAAILVPIAPLLKRMSPATKDSHTYVVSVLGVVLFAMGVAALARLFGLQPFRNSRTVLSELILILLSVSLASFGLDGVLRLWALPAPTSEMLQLALTCCALFFCRVLWRHHWDKFLRRGIAAKNILIAGNDSIGRDVRDYLASLRYAGYRFKGFVTLNEGPAHITGDHDQETVGHIDHVIALAQSLFVDEIIFSHRPAKSNLLSHVLSQAQSAGIDVRLIPDVSETLKRRTDVEYLGELPTIVLNYREKRPLSHLLKRSMDITLGSIALVVFSPLFLAIALLIRLQSTGPVFYKSNRVGYKGMVFNCYKFRTMMQNADSMRDQYVHLNERNDILFKIAKDPRVTEIGAVLRKYSLDELPQLWNVLRGDMSLVGPRPSIRSEVDQYKTAHLRRLDVVPGMTGLWQVEARHDPSFESYISLDSKYVREWSIWLDLKIIFRTANAVRKGTGT